jgi:hypothetical protein
VFAADWGYGRSTGFRGLIHDKVPEIERWLSSQAFINCSMCLGRTVTEWGRSAEQFRTHTVWDFVCDYLVTLLTRFNWLITEIEPPGEVPVNPN